MAWAVCRRSGYAEPSARVADLKRYPINGTDPPIAEPSGGVGLRAVVPEANVVAPFRSVTNLIAAVRSVLPSLPADPDPGLACCLGPIAGIESELWQLTREDLRDVPRVRVFLDFLAVHVTAMRPLLSGRVGAAGRAPPG